MPCVEKKMKEHGYQKNVAGEWYNPSNRYQHAHVFEACEWLFRMHG
jgi:hypothetical protein